MIVKNEGEIIRNTLEKLTKKVQFDYWVISDTGSTDNTIEAIESFFKEKGIKGEIYQDKWEDFAHNRTLALQYAYNKTDYILIFDADDEIEGEFKLPENYTYDGYHVYFGSNDFRYLRMPLVNNRKKWIYKGVLHEAINPLEQVTITTIEGNYYFVSYIEQRSYLDYSNNSKYKKF
jgi:glycosyltransferase involved in cell wall biosynthesis